MEGRILGVDGNTYTVKVENGDRYSFNKEEWKSQKEPTIGQLIDFTLDNEIVKDVFLIDNSTEGSSTRAIVALILTIFLGFIGTAITRFGIMNDSREEEYGKLTPTLIHLVADFMIVIPFLGWFVAIIANIYFAIQNYKACK